MLAMLRAASAAGASSIGAKVAGVVQKEGKEVNGEDGEDEGSGSDGDNEDDDDAELAEDGTVVKRSKRSGSGGSAASLPPASAMRQRVEALGYASSPHVQQVFARGSAGPHLVVVPTSVLANWVRELGAWCPGLKVVLFAGSQAERKAARKTLAAAHVVVTSYSLLEKPDTARFLAEFPWQVLVLDEAHGLKNAGSQRFKHVMDLPSRTRVLLTGTPVQNNVNELVSLLRFLVTDMFVACEGRGARYTSGDNGYEDDGEGADAESSEQGRLVEAMKTEVLRLSRGNNNGGGGDGRKGGGTTGGKKGKGASSSTAATTSLSAPGAPAGTTGPSTATASANSDGAPRTDSDAEVSAALADIMSAFILRRTKGTVDLSLPPKTRVTEWVSPTPTQRAIADTLHGVTLALAPRGGLGQAIREALDAAGADSGADAAAGAEGGDSGSGVATGDPAVERLGDGGDAMSVPPQTPLQRAPQHPMSTGAQGRNEEAPPTVLGEGPGGAAAPPGVATEDEAAPPMLPRVSARGMASPSALAPPSSPTTTLGPVFIGDLSRVLSDSDAPGSGDSGVGLDATPHPSPTGAAGATSTSSGVTGQVGRVVMLLRKAANHPLLLRARYSDAAALAAAGIVWDASRDLEPRMPDLRALGFTAGLGGGGGGGAARGGKNSKRAALAAPATEAGPLAGSGLRLVPARDDGSSSSSSSPSSDVSVAAAAFVADPSRALAEVLATAGRDSAAASGSSDTTSAIGDAGQALLRAVAAAHTPLSRPELLAWARTHLGPAPDASAPPAKSGGATGRGASSSSAAAGASTSSAASKGHEKAVKGLADLAESYLACSDYQLHCALAEWAPTCPAAAALTLPEGAFLDSGKVLFLRNLIDHLQRKPQEASASAATDGSGRARGAGAATSPGSSRGAVVRYASRVLVFSQFTQVLDILEAALGVLGHDYRRIDGSTAAAQRQAIIDDFSRCDDVPVMLLSTRAGGVGLNLTAADTVVIHDADWNPLNDAQAEDRAHRMGQTRPVTVHKTLAPGTIEMHMAETAAGKMSLVRALMTLSEKTSST